ncbi:MAG TPA: hypothetical protein VK660_00685 [Xanthomonadaceae bacterium]|jgi:hypothetical protein|nr:hypothetical protein [Xanthomonadaceae bacterium]
MEDGDIDYSGYTARELREVLAGIRRDLYPKNRANVLAALNALNENPATATREPALDRHDPWPHVPRPIWFRKTYRVALYVFVIALLILNVAALTAGSMKALVGIAFQVATLVGLVTRRQWTWIVVCVWTGLSVIGGVLLWLAVLLRGAIAVPMPQFVTGNALMVLGVFFVIFARDCLSEEDATGRTE